MKNRRSFSFPEPKLRTTFGVREVVTIPLLLFGTVIFGVGWFVGVALLWSSPFWRLRDKIIGTLLVPGGLVYGVLFVIFGSEMFGAGTHPSLVVRVLAWIVTAVALLGPLYTTIHLSRRLVRASRADSVPEYNS